MQLLFTQKIKTLLKKVCKYGCLWPHNFDNNANFKKALGHIMYMVVLLLFRLILLSKTICRLSFRGFSVVITWLVKYGRDFNITSFGRQKNLGPPRLRVERIYPWLIINCNTRAHFASLAVVQ